MRHTEHDTAGGACDGFEVRLEDILRYALATGMVLVLLLPAARGFSETLGWLPLWLLAMPGVALWALRGFPLPRRAAPALVTTARRRRSGPQARRRTRGLSRRPLSRAA
ncbi:MAG TPA: hypothetical protein VFR30_09075 [Lysobacter sp.]|nr:hypothetical protein [Lysobacter sp.]